MNSSFILGPFGGFVFEANGYPDYLSILGKVFQFNTDLIDVAVQTKEKILLSQILFCCRCVAGRAQPVTITFFDECDESRSRVVATLRISSTTKNVANGVRDRPIRRRFSLQNINIKVKEWAMDCVSGALTDDEAKVLDTITAQFPDTLTYWNLDIRNLTKAGVESVRCVMSRSSIQSLRIKCYSVDQDLWTTLVHSLVHFLRFSLLSLVLCGEAVGT